MILTVGMSPCIDVTVEVDALSLGKTNVVKSKNVTYAGKALNVAIGISRLGGKTHTTGLMYHENGYMFENMLDKEGVPFTFVWNKGRVRENYKIIDDHAMLTEVNDVGEFVPPEKSEEFLSILPAVSLRSEVVVVSGGLPKGISADYYGRIFRAVNPKALRIVDAEGERLLSALGVGVDLAKPNLEELERTLKRAISSKEDLLCALGEILKMGAKRVLLSLGKDGAVITDGKRHFYCKSMNVAVNSTVGAGDAMVAAAAMKLESGAPLDEILRAGVAAGTAAVTRKSGVSFTKEKYEAIYGELQVKEIF